MVGWKGSGSLFTRRSFLLDCAGRTESYTWPVAGNIKKKTTGSVCPYVSRSLILGPSTQRCVISLAVPQDTSIVPFASIFQHFDRTHRTRWLKSLRYTRTPWLDTYLQSMRLRKRDHEGTQLRRWVTNAPVFQSSHQRCFAGSQSYLVACQVCSEWWWTHWRLRPFICRDGVVSWNVFLKFN